MTSLETGRLGLREFGEPDWQAVHEYASDPEVVRYMDWGPNEKTASQSFVRRAISQQDEEPRKDFEFAVTLIDDGELIGGCGIHVSIPETREGWIGYCFNKRFWGQGFGTEAAGGLLRFGFGELGLHRIVALCDPRNAASIRVLEKIGMQREGHLREHRLVRGNWRDSLSYAILDREWKRTPSRHPNQR